MYIYINNKLLLYSTRNYIQYPIKNHNIKEYRKEYIHICITESLCYILETIYTVNQLYFNEKYWQVKHLIKDLYPGGSDGKQYACKCKRPRFNP